MQPNHLLAIIGLALIATSTTGLVLVKETLPSEGKEWDLKTFMLTFPTTSGSDSGSGSTPDGSSGTATLSIDDLNVTEATLRVLWTDNRPRLNRNPASISVSVRGPEGQSASGEGSGGADVTIDLGTFNTAPNDTEVQAASESDAISKATASNPSTSNGTGEWTVTITVSRGGFGGPFRRGSVDWDVMLNYDIYSLFLVGPDEAKGTETSSDRGVER